MVKAPQGNRSSDHGTTLSCHPASFMNQQGSVIASINLLIAALLVLAAAGWAFVQKGCHSYYQREAMAFFEKIEKKEISYKNINNKYRSFTTNDSQNGLRELKIDPNESQYYTYSVEAPDRGTFRIFAHLKPELLKKWYLQNPRTKLRLVYEKKEGQKGKLVD